MFEDLVETLEKPPAKERPENAWLRRAEEEEEAEKEGTEGLEGAGDTWRLLVRLI